MLRCDSIVQMCIWKSVSTLGLAIFHLRKNLFAGIFKNSCVDRLTRADCGYSHLWVGYLNQQSYACGCRLNVMRAGGCWPNACESDMTENINAAESLWYKSVATFFNSGEITGWSFQLSVIFHGLRSAWWQLTLLNERLYSKFKELVKWHTVYQHSSKSWERSAGDWLKVFTFLLYSEYWKLLLALKWTTA